MLSYRGAIPAARCGCRWLQSRDTAKLNEALEALRLARKREAVEGFVSVVEQRYPEVPRAAWEDLFGLARGYLSRLISRKKVADTRFGGRNATGG